MTSSNHSTGPPAPHFSRGVEMLLMLALSLVLLIPCVWQEHIQAGDLSSHLYNAWLAGQVHAEAVKGLTIVSVSTNVLTDWVFERLIDRNGLVAAERLVSAAAVLIFFWGAFYAIDVTTGRRPWLFSPLLAMLSYGLAFHLGFVNFYVSTGLCLWILGLCWNFSWNRILVAVPLAILAWVADAIPVIWVCSLLGYSYAVRKLPKPWHMAAPIGGMAVLVAFHVFLTSRFQYPWSLNQAFSLTGFAGITGVEQFWLYDQKYIFLSGAVLIVLLVLLMERMDAGSMLADPIVQIWILHVFALVLLPSAIQLPQYLLEYSPQRLSLLTGILFIMMVGRARYGRGITRFTALAATVFFTCLYMDGVAFNRVENEVAALVAKLPPGQRVVAGISDSGARVNALSRVADRACIEHCFSYGNSEPASGLYRIRIAGANRVVAPSLTVVQELEEGQHIATAAEEPLYSVCPFEQDPTHFYLRSIRAGEQTCAFSREISVRFTGTGLRDLFAGSGAN